MSEHETKPEPASTPAAEIARSDSRDAFPSTKRAHNALRIARAAARDIWSTQLPRMAAALAYRTIFSLIPVLVIGLVVLGAFASDEQKTDAVNQILEFTGISDIAVDDAAATGAGATEGATDGDVAAEATGALAADAAQSQRLDEWIRSLVDKVSGIKFGAIGLVGLATLFYAAISMLVEIEKSANNIFHAPSGRSWARRVPLYWTLITLGSVFLIATFAVGERVQSTLQSALSVDDGGSLTALAISYAVTTMISTVLLLIVYTTMPNTKVRLRPAFAGALIGAILWEAGKWGFTTYLEFSTNYARLYGSIAIIPIFLLWVYLTWLIVLFGLHVSYLLQHVPDWTGGSRRGDDDGPAILDPAWVVEVLAGVARGFATGKPAAVEDIARRTDLDERLVLRILESLTKAGLVHRVEAGEDEDRFTLARGPADIRADEALRVGHMLAGGSRDLAQHTALSRLRAAEVSVAAGLSLEDLIRPA